VGEPVASLGDVWWVVLIDVLVVVAGVAALGLAAWTLVVRPGLRLGRAFADLAEQAGRATDALAETAAATAPDPLSGGEAATPGRRTLPG